MNPEKQQVRDFWNQASCGEALYLSDVDKAGYAAQAKARYELEPYILDFARFGDARGLRVLEIGVGLGADHQQFAEAGADLWGIDLTERAIEHTRQRLAVFGLTSHLAVGDAENLDFPEESFDRVYSWGVLHHSPDTPKAIAEVGRVLKRGGGGKPHDLPQMEHGRLHALGALRPLGPATLADSDRDLCTLSGKPWHQGLYRYRSPTVVFRLQRGANSDGADTRGLVGVRRWSAASGLALEHRPEGLAAPIDPAISSQCRAVHVD